MSHTALQVIKKSLRELGVLQTQEEPGADMAQDCLDMLNGMLSGWDLDGIRLGHVDMVLTDTVPYPDNHYLPIAYNLAIEIAGEFEVALRPDLIAKAENGYRNLQNYYHEPVEMCVDPALRATRNPNRYFNS